MLLSAAGAALPPIGLCVDLATSRTPTSLFAWIGAIAALVLLSTVFGFGVFLLAMGVRPLGTAAVLNSADWGADPEWEDGAETERAGPARRSRWR